MKPPKVQLRRPGESSSGSFFTDQSGRNEVNSVSTLYSRQLYCESLLDYGNTIRSLASRAYPSMSLAQRNLLGRDQFIHGLHNAELRLRIRYGNPASLDDVIRVAVEDQSACRDGSSHLDHSHQLPAHPARIQLWTPSSARLLSYNRFHSSCKLHECHLFHQPGHHAV